jgi:glycosyltransferase involved in cell wall biosynthesis
MKKISFCITCWNKDIYFLPSVLNDIKSQTVQPNEIIVVANNVERLNINDKTIKTFFTQERKSVSWSRNKAATIANGDIIIFFDVDDVMHKQKIEITKHVFENTNADCFVHGFYENENLSEIYSDFKTEKIISLIDNRYLKIPSGSNKDLHHGHLSVKRDVIIKNPYNETLFWGEDAELCTRLFNLNFNFYYSHCKLINYRPSYKDMSRNWYYV